MTITLTGFMGCGKSSTGRELASMLGYPFVDLDEYIVHKAGQTIPEIFAESEQKFRFMEAEAIRDLLVMNEVSGTDMVIALGGGTIMTSSVQELILEHSICIYLRTSLETIVKRVGPDTSSRPVFSEELYPRRLATYQKARYTVDTDGKTAREVAEDIKRIL